MTSSDTFEALPLAAPIQQALRELNYTTPSPIQQRAIPPQLDGRDIIGCAQTGTGKTAAFALPILHHLAGHRVKMARGCARTLVLTPTRELAVQIGESFERYGTHLKLRQALVYGGVSQYHQVRALAHGVDILVATPGRLLDLVEQGCLDLSMVEFFVLDEVDRMLDMGFVHDVKKIAELLPKDRQTAMFTATFDRAVEQIAARFISNPVRILISPEQRTVERISQSVCHVSFENKLPLLEHLMTKVEGGKLRALIFSRTRRGAEKLSQKLHAMGLRSEAIHGDKSQAARQRALDHFRKGRVPILVATDVAARGIDVKDIGLVVNFDLPDSPDTYVHRIGRTARASASGRAVTFCDAAGLGEWRQIERHLGTEIEVDTAHPYHEEGMAHHSAHRPAKRFAKHNAGRERGKKFGSRRKRQFSKRAA